MGIRCYEITFSGSYILYGYVLGQEEKAIKSDMQGSDTTWYLSNDSLYFRGGGPGKILNLTKDTLIVIYPQDTVYFGATCVPSESPFSGTLRAGVRKSKNRKYEARKYELFFK